MDKIRSILQANSSKKMGPPVPPRPSPAVVAQALHKNRNGSPVNQPPVLQQQTHGRTVILYKSPSFSNTPKKQQEETTNHQTNDSSVSKLDFNANASVNGNNGNINNAKSNIKSVRNGHSKEDLNGNVSFIDSKNLTNGIKSANITENPMNNFIENVCYNNTEKIANNLDSNRNFFNTTTAYTLKKTNDSENNNLEANPVCSYSTENSNKAEIVIVKTETSSQLIINGEKPVTLPRKSPVALPRSKTPTTLPLVTKSSQPPQTKPPSLPPFYERKNISPPRGYLKQQAPQPPKSHNQKSVKTMNEFIKNNIYYGEDDDDENHYQDTRKNEQENGNTKIEPASEFLDANGYSNLMAKNPMLEDIVIIKKRNDQSSSNSSTLSYSSTSTMHDPDYEHYLEFENNRKNLQESIKKKETGVVDFKEKLMNEIFIRSTDDGKLIETSNDYVKFDITNRHMKRANSVDYLNERPEPEGASDVIKPKTVEDKMLEKKVVFSEMLISELTEMRKTPDYDSKNRLSLKGLKAKYTRSSPDISPNGNSRSRIRNSDVIEVDDNGKNVYSSCYISLEDSGLEDEEKLDDCSSSGVGDSWDSCKDVEER